MQQNRSQSPFPTQSAFADCCVPYWRHFHISSKVSITWNGHLNYSWNLSQQWEDKLAFKISDGIWTGSKQSKGIYNLKENGKQMLPEMCVFWHIFLSKSFMSPNWTVHHLIFYIFKKPKTSLWSILDEEHLRIKYTQIEIYHTIIKFKIIFSSNWTSFIT